MRSSKAFFSFFIFFIFTSIASFSQQADSLPSSVKKAGRQKVDRGIESVVFVPRGQLFSGLTLSYMEANSKDFDWLLVEKITAKGYTMAAKASAGYCFADDLAVGLSLQYGRTLVNLENVDLKLSEDMTFGIKDFYSLDHSFRASLFFRSYISLGRSKRFAMFNDVILYGMSGQAQIQSGKGETIKGTYQTTIGFGLNVSPGIAVFATDFMTVEASIGILGIGYSKVEQVTNQVYQGAMETMNASFQLNLLSIGLGICLYF